MGCLIGLRSGFSKTSLDRSFAHVVQPGSVPLGAMAAVGARVGRREAWGRAQALDLPALVMVTAEVGLVVWGLVERGQTGWGSPQGVLGMLAGAALIVSFIVWETRATEPMVPLGLFRAKGFAAAGPDRWRYRALRKLG